MYTNKRILHDSITEISLSPQQLNEARTLAESSGYPGLIIPNVLLQAKDAKNQNGRTYPGGILEREVQKYIENFVNNQRSFGELDHPESASVRLKEASHRIPKMWWNGPELRGDIQIIDTPNGKICEAILRAGGRLGISSRSLGSTKKIRNESTQDEVEEVQNDLEIVCWDCVSNPSVLNADFMIREGLEANTMVLNKYKRINYLIDRILHI